MTRQPVWDERIVVPARSVGNRNRVYLKELAQYLHQQTGRLRKFARRHEMLRGPRMAEWVSEYAAMRLIAYVRRMQGAIYETGESFHEVRAREARWQRQKQARKRAERTISLANSSAGTEAEPQAGGGSGTGR